MVRYFYAWTPLFLVGTLCILALPWLGLIALFVVALLVLPALVVATVVVPYMLARAVNRALNGERRAIPLTVAVPSGSKERADIVVAATRA